jgi:hypothetical protein
MLYHTTSSSSPAPSPPRSHQFTVRFSMHSALPETIQNRKTQCRLVMQTQNFDAKDSKTAGEAQ